MATHHDFVSNLVMRGTELYTVTVLRRHSPSEKMGKHQDHLGDALDGAPGFGCRGGSQASDLTDPTERL